MKRPLRVTVISCFFILCALFRVLAKAFLLIDPEAYKPALDFNWSLAEQRILHIPLCLQLAYAFAGVPLLVVSGIFMLRGRFWAFVTFLLWILLAVVLTLSVSAPSVALYAKLAVGTIVTILLTRRKSWAYFEASL